MLFERLDVMYLLKAAMQTTAEDRGPYLGVNNERPQIGSTAGPDGTCAAIEDFCPKP
jgi:hypothetical protein